MPRRFAALALAVPALALGACTAQDSSEDSAQDFKGEQRAVAQVVEDLQDAGADRDANAICERLVSPQLRRALKGNRCEQVLEDALEDADSFDLDVQKIAITGDRATATVKSEAGEDDRTDELTLVRDGRNWRLDGLGRVAAAG